MIKFNKYRSLTLAGLMLSACGGDESSVVDQIPVDYSGNWIGACLQADTSFAVDPGEVYYNDLINITDTRIFIAISDISIAKHTTPNALLPQ